LTCLVKALCLASKQSTRLACADLQAAGTTSHKATQGRGAAGRRRQPEQQQLAASLIGHTPNSGNPYTFNDYKALLLTTADTYDYERSAKRCPT